MAKERVVVFEGEDKFIAPKEQIFDKQKGKSEFASQTGEPSINPEYDAFKRYMLNKDAKVQVPSTSDPDFCKTVTNFINTRGDGKATPDQIIEAYNLFRDNCIEKPEEKKPVDTDSPPPTPKSEEPSAPAETPKASVANMPPAFVPLNVPNLGKPPSSKTGGVEVEQKKEEPSKNNNLLIWLVLGGVAIYLITRKNK